MLSELEDSLNIMREVIERLAKNFTWSEESSESISKFILSQQRLTISYTGTGLLPSKALFFSFKTLAPEREVYIRSASSLIYHYIPYVDSPGGVLLFYGSAWERSELLRTIDTLNLMNVDYLAFLASPPDEIIEKKIADERAIIAPSPAGIIDHIYVAVKSGIKAAEKVTGRGDFRIKRLREEVSELRGLYEDLIAIHGECAAIFREAFNSPSPIAILHSPSMEVPALLLQSLLMSQGKVALVYEFSAAPIESISRLSALALYTEVEADAFKEINFRMMKSGMRPRALRFPFDPITGQLYASISLYAATKSIYSRII